MIRSAIFTLLTGDSDLAKSVATRIYPDKLPQKPKYTSITYQVVNAPRDYTQEGPSGLVDATFRFIIYAETMAKAELTAKRLRAVLSGYSGSVVVGMETVEIHGAFCVNESDAPESSTETGGPINITQLALTFTVWHKE